MLPIIDVSSFAPGQAAPSDSAAAALDQALRETGFVFIEGHGIRPDTTAALLDQMRRFFALPLAEKQKISVANSSCFRGYSALATEVLDDAHPQFGDLKEALDSGIDFGPDHPQVRAGTPLYGPTQLPDLPGFRDAHDAYLGEAIAAAERTQRALAHALGLPIDFFLGLGEPMYHLRLNYYPVQDPARQLRGQYGCSAHSDYPLITLLTDDGVPGLQVMHRDGEWHDVVVPPGLVLVNLGDLAAIWTNDRYVSNPHRVVPMANHDRCSIPLFVTPPFFANVECLPTCLAPGETAKYEPRLAGPYLLSRFDINYGYRNALLEQHHRSVARATAG